MFYNINIMLFIVTIIFYFAGALLYISFFLSRKESIFSIARYIIILSFIFHTATLLARYIESGYLPLTSLFEAILFFTWLIIFLFILVEKRYQLSVLGVFIIPLTFLTLSYALILPKDISPLNPILKSAWLGIHVTLILLGNAAFAIAFGLGIMYLLQERQLKSRKQGLFYYRLPSLEILDDLGYKALSFGFPFLTLGIITGSIWAKYAWGSYWNWDPKLVWSLITWLIYASLLHGRLTIGWRGRKAAFISIIGFLCVVFTFVGVNFLLKTEHLF